MGVPASAAAPGVYILNTLFTFTTVTCPAEKIDIFIINILGDKTRSHQRWGVLEVVTWVNRVDAQDA